MIQELPDLEHIQHEPPEVTLCRLSFVDFVHHFWDSVPSSEPLEWNWHLDVLCSEMEKAAIRVFNHEPCEYDTIFNVPFGTSKSTICSILFQPWTWTNMPRARHMSATYTEPLGLDLSGKALAVCLSDKYQCWFPEVKITTSATGVFKNNHGGERRICTVGGKSPLGFHAHFLGCDDPLDPKGALSEAELGTARHFVETILPTRKVNKVVSWTYLVMQRLGRGDPSEVMENMGKKPGAIPVRKIVFPGEISPDVFPPECGQYYKGGLLDPRRLPRSVLNAYKARGSLFYSSQVMQNPLAMGGGMFKESYFNNRVKAAPYHAKRVRYWDRASTDSGGCATAGLLMAFAQSNYYIEHCEVGQWEPVERNARILAMALRDRTRYGPLEEPMIIIEEEGGSTSADARKMLGAVLEGFNFRFERPTGSKDIRAEPFSAQCAAGNVYLVDNGESQNAGKADWDINAYVKELCLFKPDAGKRLGGMKDRVDASSGAFNWLYRPFKQGTLQIRRFGATNYQGLRILVISEEEMELAIIEEPAILIHCADIVNPIPIPTGNCHKLLGKVQVLGHDIQPEEYQDKWDVSVEPFGVLPEQLMLKPPEAKKLWSLVIKQHDPQCRVIVVVDSGGHDRRGESIALAINDGLGLDRAKTLCRLESDWKRTKTDNAPNGHMYAAVRAAKALVVS